MKLGFLTNALVWEGLNDIEKMAQWAAENGFQALEVGPALPLDEDAFRRVTADGKVQITALTYCRNFLSTDQEEAKRHQAELFRRIETAGRLGIPTIVTSTGINDCGDRGYGYEAIRRLPAKSLDEVAFFLEKVLKLAEKANVRIALENCPLMGDIAISPEIWRKLFEKLDCEYLGLAYDPSHLVWQMIDPYLPIKEFSGKIFHVHAKDTEILHDKLAQTGILTDFSWWRYRLPGLGDLNWAKFISLLRETGYTGTVSIEHEDPVWGGTIEKIQQGLMIAKKYLEQVPGFQCVK